PDGRVRMGELPGGHRGGRPGDGRMQRVHRRRWWRLRRSRAPARHGRPDLAPVHRRRCRIGAVGRQGTARRGGVGEVGFVSERRELICGNWEMNSNHLEAIQMIQKLHYRLEPDVYERVEVVVAPPFTSLRSAQTVIETDRMQIGLGAQNVFWEDEGAYTG